MLHAKLDPRSQAPPFTCHHTQIVGSAMIQQRKEKSIQAKGRIKGRPPNWKTKGLTRRPSQPTLDTASLGERARNRPNGDLKGRSPCSWAPRLSFFRPPPPRAQHPPPSRPQGLRENKEHI
eukprot:1015417-Pelagomonas_calceolata.AAC.1